MKKYFLTTAAAILTIISGVSAQDKVATPSSVPVQAPVAAPAQEEKTDPNAAVIKFDQEVLDYGTINKGDEPLRMFKFTNDGKSPLIITNCQGSCGCTVPECPKESIMPGQSGELKVRYDTKRIGNFNKTVTVKSNASNSVVYLKIKGVVLDVKKPDAFPAKKTDGPASN